MQSIFTGTLAFAGTTFLASAAITTRMALRRSRPPTARKGSRKVAFGKVPVMKDYWDSPEKANIQKWVDPPREIEDTYAWLRDETRKDPEVLGWLHAQNEYVKAQMEGPMDELKDELYKELISRMRETDVGLPHRHGAFYYYSRQEKGKSYSIYCRKAAVAPATEASSAGAAAAEAETASRSASDVPERAPRKPEEIPGDSPEEVVLDENEVAAGHEHCDVGVTEVSPSETVLAYAVDLSGNETYDVHFKPLESPPAAAAAASKSKSEGEAATGRVPTMPAGALGEVLTNTSGDVEWGPDDRTLYYVTNDETLRPHKVWRHVMGRPQDEDELLFEEKDDTMRVGLITTVDRRFLLVRSGRADTSETSLLDLRAVAAQDLGAPVKGLLRTVSPRRAGHKYSVSMREETMYIVSNRNGRREGSLFLAPLGSLEEARGENAWVELRPYNRGIQLTSCVARRNFAVLGGRQGGFPRSWVVHGAALDEAEAACAKIAAEVGGAVSKSEGGDRHVPPSTVKGIKELPGPDRPVLPRAPPLVVLPAGGGEGASCVYASPQELDYETPLVRVTSTSMLAPSATFQFDATRCAHRTAACEERAATLAADPSQYMLLKRRDVPNTDPSKYRSTVVHAKVPRHALPEGAPLPAAASLDDWVHVPISLLWRPDAMRSEGARGAAEEAARAGTDQVGPASGAGAGSDEESPPWSKEEAPPLMLEGYGSYGISSDPYFSVAKLAYADRGVVVGVAHVRGGGDLGRYWYEEQGRLLQKPNTFTDFNACARRLVHLGWGKGGRLGCGGGSAGGLLVGNAILREPALWHACLADVPFVDLMATMSDPSIPLTTGEWTEWGNPHDKRFYECMLSYSPMQMVKEGVNYPNVLICAGLHDPRVAYWEPAKWAAHLQAKHKDGGEGEEGDKRHILLKTDMTSGHFSASDRYHSRRELAIELSFMISKLLQPQ